MIEKLLRATMRHRAGLSVVNMADDRETAVDGAGGYTALHAAAFHGNDEAVAVLLRHGADPRARDRKYCSTPAGWAAYAGRVRTAEVLLEADVDIFDAIAFDRADRIDDILDRDPGALDRQFKAYASCEARAGQSRPAPDCTPLEWATAQGKERATRALASVSRDIWTLCFHGFVDRVRAILAHDPGLARVAAANGQTPLWWLPDDEERAMAMVEALLAAGADPSKTDREGRTAADRARRRGMVQVADRIEGASGG